MEKLENLEQQNLQAHEKFNQAIIELVQAKLSNRALNFIQPQFYKEQKAKTTTQIFENNQIQVELGELPEFYGLAEHKINILKAQKLSESFQQILVEYVAYANYLNRVINKQ